MKDLVCMDCGGPLFENFVRRFDEPTRAVAPNSGGTRELHETPARTKYKDGRQCRKCGAFFPFRAKSESA